MRSLSSNYTVVFTLGALEQLRGLEPGVRNQIQVQADALAQAVEDREVAPPRPGEAPRRGNFVVEGHQVLFEVRRQDRSLRVFQISAGALPPGGG